MARRPDGPPPPPTVQRLRIHYAKRGRLRFSSHRDFQRSLERAIRRGSVPIAFSAGFSPHPKVSYANAAPTGVASEAEYLEIGVAQRCDPTKLAAVLDECLPQGFDIVEVVEARDGSLADRLEASRWQIVLPGLEPDQAAAAVADFLAAQEVEVERTTKNGLRRFDARAAVVAMTVEPPARAAEGDGTPCAILDVVVRHTSPAVRPDDVLTGLRERSGLTPSVPPRVTRLAQGPLDARTAAIGDPLDPDRGEPVVASTG